MAIVTAEPGKVQTDLQEASVEGDERGGAGVLERDHLRGGEGMHKGLASAGLSMPVALEEAHCTQGSAVH